MKYLFLIVLGMVCFSLGCGNDSVVAPTAGNMTAAEMNELPSEVQQVGRPMPPAGDAEAAANNPVPEK